MERMSKIKTTYIYDDETGTAELTELKEVGELKEENKKLNEWKENLIRADKKKSDHIDNLEEENRKLKSERDKWRGKYNRLKSEFNLLKNKIGTTQK